MSHYNTNVATKTVFGNLIQKSYSAIPRQAVPKQNDLFEDSIFAETYDKTKHSYTSIEDLLVLSVVCKRIRVDEGSYVDLLDPYIVKKVTDADRVEAATIRDYYSKKLMCAILKNETLTAFRQDLKEFICTDGKNFHEKIKPLVYRLPEFYEYDTEVDQMFNQYNRVVEGYSVFKQETKKLTYVATFDVVKKRTKLKEYWFKDSSNNLVSFRFVVGNPLMSLLDKSIGQELEISGSYRKITIDGKEFLYAKNFSFV